MAKAEQSVFYYNVYVRVKPAAAGKRLQAIMVGDAVKRRPHHEEIRRKALNLLVLSYTAYPSTNEVRSDFGKAERRPCWKPLFGFRFDFAIGECRGGLGDSIRSRASRQILIYRAVDSRIMG